MAQQLSVAAEELARKLRTKHDVEDIRPVPVETIVHEEGGKLRRRMMTVDASLTFLKKGGGFRIDVNSTHPTPRQRFSIGHELGHVLLSRIDDTGVAEAEAGSCEFSPVETHGAREEFCNRFSAHLLIPDDVIVWLTDWGALTIESLREASERCQVSLEAVVRQVVGRLAGDGGVMCLRKAGTPENEHDRKLRVDWAFFPRAPRLRPKRYTEVYETPLIEEMLGIDEETVFKDARIALPGLVLDRDVRAATVGSSLVLLAYPRKQPS